MMDWARGGGPCWWCGRPSLGRVWGQGDEQWMSICPSCVEAMKAVLPDAPDWRMVYRNTARSIYNLAHAALYPTTASEYNPIPIAQAILEAAQRLVEAAGHLQEET